MVQTHAKLGKNARVAREKRKRRREEAVRNREQHHASMRDIFREVAPEAGAQLDPAQLKVFLAKVNESQNEPPMEPHELEHAVDFVMSAADKDRDGGIGLLELVPAMAAWNNWTLSRDGLFAEVKELLAKHDADASGSLDRQELEQLLFELNAHQKLEGAIVDKIWETADRDQNGKVDIAELAPAMSKWDRGEFNQLKGKSKYAVAGNSAGGGDGGGGDSGSDGTIGKGCGCIIS